MSHGSIGAMSTQAKTASSAGRGPGRPSKGDRHVFLTRVEFDAGDAAMLEAVRRGLTYSEYLANVVAAAHGYSAPMPDPVLDLAQLEVHDIKKVQVTGGSFYKFVIRVPRVVANTVIRSAAQLGVTRSEYLATVIAAAHGFASPWPLDDALEPAS